MSYSLWPPWSVQSMEFSPGQKTGMSSCSLLQGNLRNPGTELRSPHIAGGFFTSWATREAQEYWSGWLIPSLADLPNPGIELGSPALQADSLQTELSKKGNTAMKIRCCECGNGCVLAKSLQSCLTLCNPVDRSLPVSSVHGILQAKILEWVTVLCSRGSS